MRNVQRRNFEMGFIKMLMCLSWCCYSLTVLRAQWMVKIVRIAKYWIKKSVDGNMERSQTRLEVSNRHNWPLPVKSVILSIMKQVLGLG